MTDQIDETNAARWSEELEEMKPGTGRLIGEGGVIRNIADLLNTIANAGGGGGGDASAENQQTAIALLTALSNVLNGDADLVIDTELATAIVNVGAGATTEVIAAPGANKQIWVYGALLMADVAGTIALTQGGSPLTGVQPVGDTGGFSLPLSNNYKFPWIKLPSNEGLDVTTVTCTADGIIAYAIIDVS